MKDNINDYIVKRKLSKVTAKAIGGLLISGCLFAGGALGVKNSAKKIQNIEADFANSSEEFINYIQSEKTKAKQLYEAKELTYIEYMQRLEKINSKESISDAFEKYAGESEKNKVKELSYLNYASAFGLLGGTLACLGTGIDAMVNLVSNGLIETTYEIKKDEDEKEL